MQRLCRRNVVDAQQEHPDDYVLATGQTYTIKEFIEKSFEFVNIDLIWEGSGKNEVGKDNKTGKILITIDEKYFRPSEVDLLLGDPSKANNILGWKHKMDLDDIIRDMFLN